jgi:hypothetical protein
MVVCRHGSCCCRLMVTGLAYVVAAMTGSAADSHTRYGPSCVIIPAAIKVVITKPANAGPYEPVKSKMSRVQADDAKSRPDRLPVLHRQAKRVLLRGSMIFDEDCWFPVSLTKSSHRQHDRVTHLWFHTTYLI